MGKIDWSLKPLEWAPVPLDGFEHYKVSNYGDVVNTKTGKHLSPGTFGLNRPAVSLCSNGKVKFVHVYRLVAMAFIPNPNNYPQVNHINGDVWDSYVENLEWCTKDQNFWHCRMFELLENRRAPADELLEIDLPYYIVNGLYEIMKRENITFSAILKKAADEFIENHLKTV